MGLIEVAKRFANVFEVNMAPEEFCERYKLRMEAQGVAEGVPSE